MCPPDVILIQSVDSASVAAPLADAKAAGIPVIELTTSDPQLPSAEAFVGLLVVGTIGLAFVLQAADMPNPGTIATIACGIALVLGGPALMRVLGRLMRRQAGVG